jgi:hypothetical protein
MRRHDDANEQWFFERWNESVLDQADHRIDCAAGCSILGDVCEIGLGWAREEQRRWRDYHDARQTAVTA